MLALVSACDALMLGAYNVESMSAVSLAGQVQFVINIFVSAICAGLGIMMAQYWGKKDIETIEKTIPIALRFNFIVGLIFTIFTLLFPNVLMSFFTNGSVLKTYGIDYLRYVALSYFFVSLSQIYLTVLKNSDLSNISSRISSFAVIFNIICNYLLIFGIGFFPQLGVKGAAIATVLARFIELIWAYIECKKKDRVKVKWQFFNFDPLLKKDFFHYTYPVMTAGLVWAIAYTSYSAIMGHMGTDAVTANSITAIARSLSSCFIRGVAAGASIIIGNLLGANELEKAKKYGRKLVHIALFTGICTCLVLVILAFVLSGVLNISSLAKTYLKYMMIFSGINIIAQSCATTVLDGIFCAGGDSKFDMDTNILVMWCFTLPLGLLAAFVFKWPAMVVYCIVNLDEIIKMPRVFRRYQKYIWLKNITR